LAYCAWLNCRQNSVFVEFAEFDSVKRFLEADPKPTFDGSELLTMSKCVSPKPTRPDTDPTYREAYCAMKIKEKGLDKKGITPRTHSGTGGAGGRRQFDAFQLKDGVLPKDKKDKEAVVVKFHGKEYAVDAQGKVDVSIESFEYEKGSALKFTGAGSEDPKFGEIKVRRSGLMQARSGCSSRFRSR
jgi:lupus La protein